MTNSAFTSTLHGGYSDEKSSSLISGTRFDVEKGPQVHVTVDYNTSSLSKEEETSESSKSVSDPPSPAGPTTYRREASNSRRLLVHTVLLSRVERCLVHSHCLTRSDRSSVKVLTELESSRRLAERQFIIFVFHTVFPVTFLLVLLRCN
jgi:hypothetical protein